MRDLNFNGQNFFDILAKFAPEIFGQDINILNELNRFI